LAIVAYKQPISRGQISAIRGVNVEATLHTLIQRGYVAEQGRDPGPGLAALYGTTTLFLERLGLDSLQALPPLGDFVPDAGIVETLERGLRLSQNAATSAVDPTEDDLERRDADDAS
jgi:segregation and condensation protein B